MNSVQNAFHYCYFLLHKTHLTGSGELSYFIHFSSFVHIYIYSAQTEWLASVRQCVSACPHLPSLWPPCDKKNCSAQYDSHGSSYCPSHAAPLLLNSLTPVSPGRVAHRSIAPHALCASRIHSDRHRLAVRR